MGIGTFLVGGLVGVGAGYVVWGPGKQALQAAKAAAQVPSNSIVVRQPPAMLVIQPAGSLAGTLQAPTGTFHYGEHYDPRYNPAGDVVMTKKLALPNVKAPKPGTLVPASGSYGYGENVDTSFNPMFARPEWVAAPDPAVQQYRMAEIHREVLPGLENVPDLRRQMNLPYPSFFSNVPTYPVMRMLVQQGIGEIELAMARELHAPVVITRRGLGTSNIPLYQFLSMNDAPTARFDAGQATLLSTDLGPMFEMGNPDRNEERIFVRYHPGMENWINLFLAETIVRQTIQRRG